MTKASPGALISHAAYSARGAERLLIAALIHLEDAEAEIDDLTFVADARLEFIDVRPALEVMGIFSRNLIRLADAYGHAEVRRRSERRR